MTKCVGILLTSFVILYFLNATSVKVTASVLHNVLYYFLVGGLSLYCSRISMYFFYCVHKIKIMIKKTSLEEFTVTLFIG